VALLLSPGKRQGREYVRLIFLDNISYQTFKNTEHRVDFMGLEEGLCKLTWNDCNQNHKLVKIHFYQICWLKNHDDRLQIRSFDGLLTVFKTKWCPVQIFMLIHVTFITSSVKVKRYYL